MTSQTLAHNLVPEHQCTETGIDCAVCLKADAATARYESNRRERKTNPKRRKTVVGDARPVTAQTVTHVAGDVPLPSLRWNEAYDYAGTKTTGLTVNEVPEPGVSDLQQSPPQAPASPASGAGPAPDEPSKLSDATAARGFILAGNAYFTVRSLRTGVRYTYRVSRGKCSRCGRTDCACWKNPIYFVALLTGPDNQGDYTYLGMLKEESFRLTQASKMNDSAAPVKAFRWVWDHLAKGVYPPTCEVWHEGRCGVCGRPLTVPESIASGIGPVCAEKGGV